jgi:hypothetical protein
MSFLQKIWAWSIMGNVWLWFHISGGGCGAKAFNLYLDKLESLLLLFAITILWEVFEFFWDGGIEGMIKIYGSLERWAYDCAGDVLGALIMALIVVM